MNERVRIKLDTETQRLIKLACEKLNVTPEQVLEEAVKEYIEHLRQKHP